MRKGGWKKWLGWGLGVVALMAIFLALTPKWWLPRALKIALAGRGVKVEAVVWPTNGVWRFEGVEAQRYGFTFRAAKVTTFGPKAWKEALKNPSTNAPAFVTLDRWRLILPTRGGSRANTVVVGLNGFQVQMEELKRKCPRAVLLNGVVQSGSGEFRSGVIEWKNGELAGDFTWPGLNDPAEFKLKVTESNKPQFILRQRALDLGSRITATIQTNEARIAGYVRWKESKADFDCLFDGKGNMPKAGFMKSDGLQLPRELLKIPGVKQMNARMNLEITNGQFRLKVGGAGGN